MLRDEVTVMRYWILYRCERVRCASTCSYRWLPEVARLLVVDVQVYATTRQCSQSTPVV